ncbi:MAG TPA: Phenylacetic acid catabolic protein [Longimicrobiales bacterium]|nr:Phenylacetic acid catabolic protein [Longimicrobiales bacterium]
MSTKTSEAVAPATSETRDLILCLADTKRLLGYRYAEWMLGAPELETGIALSSMAQDEWGHARLLYALLKAFGEDVEVLEHGREPDLYHSMDALDEPAAAWPDVVALMLVVDQALTVQLDALRDSSHEPLRQRVEKMVEEERFHAAHAMAWTRRLSGGGAAREAVRESVERVLPAALRWFGPDVGAAEALREAGVTTAVSSTLRSRLLDRLRPALAVLGAEPSAMAEPDFAGIDERRRRGEGAPDAATIQRIRGDRNRAFLMD